MSNQALTILIADDDLEDLELIETAIMGIKPDINLQTVTNGEAVIEYLTSQPDSKLPCLVILDYNMPDYTGLDLLSIMSKDKRYENIPKIILSTSSTAAHVNNCLNSGATEYIVKPNNMNELSNVARKILGYCTNNGL